ncbi:MAG TPA: NUDIX domain-containing protein [Firmicutes bacterium]|nr:NUDIX domain-containing protein [Bacillota bacterium]
MTNATHQVLTEYLQRESISIPLAEMWPQPHIQRVSALCLLERENRFLLLQRIKAPFKGLWTAPGGKVQAGEHPEQAVIRELREETGLQLLRPRLRLIASETGPQPYYNWLCFMFHCTEVVGNLHAGDEGILRWVAQADIAAMDRPEIDVLLFAKVLNTEQRWLATVRFGEQGAVEALRMTVMT